MLRHFGSVSPVLNHKHLRQPTWSDGGVAGAVSRRKHLIKFGALPLPSLHLEFGGQTLHSWLVPKHTTKHPIQFILVVRKIPNKIPELQLANNGADCKKGWQNMAKRCMSSARGDYWRVLKDLKKSPILILPAKLADHNFITCKPQKRNMLFTPVLRWLSVTAEKNMKKLSSSYIMLR